MEHLLLKKIYSHADNDKVRNKIKIKNLCEPIFSSISERKYNPTKLESKCSKLM